MDVYGNYSMSTQYIMKIMEIEICLILVPLHTDSFAIVSSWKQDYEFGEMNVYHFFFFSHWIFNNSRPF